jgi:hypothetical protein
MEEISENLFGLIKSKTEEGLSPNDFKEIYLGVLALLPDQIDRFTLCDSSSVRSEVAEELLKSICFTLRLYLEAENLPYNALKKGDLYEMFNKGRKVIELRVEEAKELYKAVLQTAPEIQNISYSDTVTGIGVFFKQYDLYFFAHEIPCSIDYQLCHNVPETSLGVEYIVEYLRRMLIENQFCRHFEPVVAKEVLLSISPDYKELLINLCEPLAVNAIGLVLTGSDIYSLSITKEDHLKIYEMFKKLNKAEATKLLEAASEELCRELLIKDEDSIYYLKKIASELYPRLAAATSPSGLKGVFLELTKNLEKKKDATEFVDGAMMDNDRLRALIAEISDCRLPDEKAAAAMRKTRSLRDLTEILDVCFWGDESISLFKALGSLELQILLDFVHKKSPERFSETGWEQKLLEYIESKT